MFLIVCTETTESKQVKLESSCTVALPLRPVLFALTLRKVPFAILVNT